MVEPKRVYLNLTSNLLTSFLIGRELDLPGLSDLIRDLIRSWSALSGDLIRPDQRPDQGDQTRVETWSSLSDLSRDLIKVDQTRGETWSKLIWPEWRPDQTWSETWSKLIRPEWIPDQGDQTCLETWSKLIWPERRPDRTSVETWSKLIRFE